MSHWGYHLSVDAGECDRNLATDPDYIKRFASALVEAIDMETFGDPEVFHFADHCPDKAGWTMHTWLTTSTLTAHFLDGTGDCYLDVFSCKEFDIKKVLSMITSWFSPKRVSESYRTRQA